MQIATIAEDRDLRPRAAACSGCGLCVLVCPVWRETADPRLVPKGLVRAVQHGASPVECVPAVDACWLCGACDPVCPEGIDPMEVVLALRRRLGPRGSDSRPRRNAGAPARPWPIARPAALLAGAALRRDGPRAAQVSRALNCEIADLDCESLAQRLAEGGAIDCERLETSVAGLGKGRALIVADGLLLHALRRSFPDRRILGLGEALSGLEPVRRALGPGDLYVIDPLPYHADYERLVAHYDALRQAAGCMLNLDLQRIALPVAPRRRGGAAGAAADAAVAWLMHRRGVTRIVVECERDAGVLRSCTSLPVLCAWELLDPAVAT